MSTLPLMTEARWARMSWQARQQWLRASTALMRQVRAELEALEGDERSRVARTLGRELDLERIAEDGRAHGADRLEALA